MSLIGGGGECIVFLYFKFLFRVLSVGRSWPQSLRTSLVSSLAHPLPCSSSFLLTGNFPGPGPGSSPIYLKVQIDFDAD